MGMRGPSMRGIGTDCPYVVHTGASIVAWAGENPRLWWCIVEGQEACMTLNAPKQIVFIIAVVLAVLALLGYFVAIPFVSTYAFWILLIGFIVLAGGVTMKGT